MPEPSASPASDPVILSHIQHTFDTRTLASPIYAFLLRPATLTHASKGLVRATLTLAEEHMNSSGSVHGAVLATFVDWAGGMAIASWDGREKTGVSVDIHVSYLAGAKVGDRIEIEGRAERVGGNVAFTSVDVYAIDEQGRRTKDIIHGRHTKFVRGSAPFKEASTSA